MKERKNIFILVSVFFLLPLMLGSCTDIMAPKEYVSVYIRNHTEEQLLVYAGMSILFIGVPSTVIPTKTGQSVMAVKGKSVDVYGKNSGRNYGSRTFYAESQWDVY